MTQDQMLKTLIGCVERYFDAQKKYEEHPGGGASQKIKNQLARERKIARTELSNAVFNIKQFLK